MFIKIKDIQDSFPEIPIRGIIHVGAHDAEELDDYSKIGISNIVWIEGNPHLTDTLIERFKDDENIIVLNEIVLDEEKEVVFNISNNGQSSSILPLKEHKNKFGDVYYVGHMTVTSKRLDTIIKENSLDIKKYNFLNVDVQGVDLNVIVSLGDNLKSFDYIYTEINTIEMYEGCHLLHEVDKKLSEYGFSRVMIHEYIGGGWGDALYLKRK